MSGAEWPQSFEEAAYRSVAAGMDGDRPLEFARLDLEPPAVTGNGKESLLSVDPRSARALAERAFNALQHRLRPGFLAQLSAMAEAPAASEGERAALAALLSNARLAAEGVFPLCQDTGTAAVSVWRGERVLCNGLGDALAQGARDAWAAGRFRASQLALDPAGVERDSGDNAPLAVDTHLVPGNALRFLFSAKGGGSSNKTALFQETRRVLEPARLAAFIHAAVGSLGVSACPPYRVVLVIGGQSPEETLKALKLACLGALDALPSTGPSPCRDPQLESLVMDAASASGWGAQFGGRFLARDARVIRLGRHAASLPVGLGVSCVAHRQALAYADPSGWYLERLAGPGDVPAVPAPRGGQALRLDLGPGWVPPPGLKAGQLVALHGQVVLARDAAHARLSRLLAEGSALPEWTRYPVYYAGPAGTPDGQVIGSLGPTTAKRMDSYCDELMGSGAFKVMIGKGERGHECRDACARHGGVYLAAVGGAAALGASRVRSATLLAWPELGMEAVRLVELDGLTAVVAIDPDGGDIYAGLPFSSQRR